MEFYVANLSHSFSIEACRFVLMDLAGLTQQMSLEYGHNSDSASGVWLIFHQTLHLNRQLSSCWPVYLISRLPSGHPKTFDRLILGQLSFESVLLSGV